MAISGQSRVSDKCSCKETPTNYMIHNDIQIEYHTLAKALGSYGEANRHFEFSVDGGRTWVGSRAEYPLTFISTVLHRRVRSTHIVNGYEVPSPYCEPPKSGEYYFIDGGSIKAAEWSHHCVNSERLRSNNCFKSYTDAEDNRLAMFKLGKYKERR